MRKEKKLEKTLNFILPHFSFLDLSHFFLLLRGLKLGRFTGSFLNYRPTSTTNIQQNNILKRRNSIAVPSSLLSVDSSNSFNRMRKRSSLPNHIEEHEPDMNRIEIHDISNHSNKLNSIAEIIANTCHNNNDNSTASVTTDNLETSNDDLLRKKSAAINLLYPTRRNSTQIVSTLGPYTVKRKFSMGQVKVRPEFNYSTLFVLCF